MTQQDLPPRAQLAIAAVEREAPEYAVGFTHFLATEIFGMTWSAGVGVSGREVGLVPPSVETDPRVLPGKAWFAEEAVERAAPEYVLAFVRFLVTRVCGATWMDVRVPSASAAEGSEQPVQPEDLDRTCPSR